MKIYSKMKAFDSRSEKNKRLNYYGLYTVLFIVVCCMVFSGFYLNNKSLIFEGDAIKQHFNSLAYFGKYLRGIIKTLFSTGDFMIPLWDSQIGFGSDLITTLNYYVLGDPLNLLSVFVPASRTEILYEFLILLRLYLAGIGFSILCRGMKRGRFVTMCGAFVYVFCSYALFSAVRHPFFINPMVYLPFLIIGIEKIFSGKKPFLFIGMVFVSGISNFYFFYMLSIIIFVYAVIRFFFVYQENRVKNFFLCLRNFCGYYIIGTLLSCIIFLPNALALLNTQRFNVNASVPLLYDIDYYQKLLFYFIDGRQLTNWTWIACSAIVLPAIILLFMKRKKNLFLKVTFIVLTLFLIFPYIGHVINGFSYASNRWTWAYALLLGVIFTTMLPDLMSVSKKQFGILLGISILYLAGRIYMSEEGLEQFYPYWILMVSGLLILLISSLTRGKMSRFAVLHRGVTYTAIFALTIAGIVGQANDKYGQKSGGYKRFLDKGEAYPKLMNETLTTIKGIEDSDFFRYEMMGSAAQQSLTNSSMINGVNGMDFYFSVADGNISNFLSEISNRYYLSYCYRGLDNRSSLDTLSNVKYQIVGKDQKRMPFYGYVPYQEQERQQSPLQIYENQYALPFGYTYEKYIPRDKYDPLTPLEKQEAMLSGAVLDQTTQELPEVTPELAVREVPISIEYNKGVQFKDGVFVVKKRNASILLNVKGIPDSENYVVFDGMVFSDLKPDQMSTSAGINVSALDISKGFNIHTKYYRSFSGREEYTTNMGYSKEPVKKIKIKFQNKGFYKVDSLKVMSQPMNSYPEQVNRLKEDTMENTVFSPNRINGNIKLDKTKLLCLSIPYSKGWSAYIDGEKAEVLRTNSIYSGVIVDPGNHQIELRYFTPGLKAGILCFILGIISLAGMVVHQKRRTSRNI